MAQKKKPTKAWSKTGKTAIKKKKTFNWRKYLPVIAVIALVGGFFVWRSFAATKLYDYQYSVYQCSGFDSKKINPDDTCVKNSAEAMTYRYYEGVLGRSPDSSGYKYYVQKFAGDRVQPTDVAGKFVSASKAASAKSGEVFVKDLYKGMLKRSPSNKDLVYWVSRVNSKEWSRGKLVAHFASTDEAKKTNKAAFANYLASAPKVAVTQTAIKTRDERLWQATLNANAGQKLYDSIKSYSNTAKSALSSAKSSSSKSKPTLTDLQAISDNDKTVRELATKTNSPRSKLATYVSENKKYYDRAQAVEAYSPDVSAAAVKKQYDRSVVYGKEASNINSELTGAYKQIAVYYNTALDKYQASQAPVTGSDKCDVNADCPAPPYKSPAGYTKEECDAKADWVYVRTIPGGKRFETWGFQWTGSNSSSGGCRVIAIKTSWNVDCRSGYKPAANKLGCTRDVATAKYANPVSYTCLWNKSGAVAKNSRYLISAYRDGRNKYACADSGKSISIRCPSGFSPISWSASGRKVMACRRG